MSFQNLLFFFFEKEKYILLEGIGGYFLINIIKLLCIQVKLKSVWICFRTTILRLFLTKTAKIFYNIVFTISSQGPQEWCPLLAPLRHPAAMLAVLLTLHLLQPPVLSVLRWGSAFQGLKECGEQLTNIHFKAGNH